MGSAIIPDRRLERPHPEKLKKMTRNWWGSSWKAIWVDFKSGLTNEGNAPVQHGDPWVDRLALHNGIRKAEGTAVTQMRTG